MVRKKEVSNEWLKDMVKKAESKDIEPKPQFHSWEKKDFDNVENLAKNLKNRAADSK